LDRAGVDHCDLVGPAGALLPRSNAGAGQIADATMLTSAQGARLTQLQPGSSLGVITGWSALPQLMRAAITVVSC